MLHEKGCNLETAWTIKKSLHHISPIYHSVDLTNRGEISCRAIWGSLCTGVSQILTSWVNHNWVPGPGALTLWIGDEEPGEKKLLKAISRPWYHGNMGNCRFAMPGCKCSTISWMIIYLNHTEFFFNQWKRGTVLPGFIVNCSKDYWCKE